MRLLRWAVLCVCAAATCALSAQTYTPRQVRFEGGGDPAQLLQLTGLEAGKPVTKAQIEAAMQKLADTGAFTDLSYTVNAEALTIKLAGATQAGGQAKPVRYANLMWWQPAELTKLLEARVPLFHGELPLTGSLTDQVRAAVVSLLAEKAVSGAHVDAISTHDGGIALDVTQPEVMVGEITLTGVVPTTQGQVERVKAGLRTQEFDRVDTASEIRNNIADTEQNAGYLDAHVDAPTFSTPRKDMDHYAVDAAAVVLPGELYRLGKIEVNAAPPLRDSDVVEASELKTGAPAGAMTMRIGEGLVQRAYVARGYLGAHVVAKPTMDSSTHTVLVHFTTEPGELYHLAAVDTSALPAELQSGFAREFHGKPGMPAGSELDKQVSLALRALNANQSVSSSEVLHQADHTVTVQLMPRGTRVAHPPT